MNIDHLMSQPRPASDYAEAMTRFEAIRAGETGAINPRCHTRLLSHHEKTEQAVLFLHGLTNCPQQFYKLGLSFYKLGYNVLIARLPYHGLADRLTTDLVSLKAKDLAVHTDMVVNIGRGLGRQVVLVGFSTGGVMASWAAQQRGDIDRAVIVSPFFTYRFIPGFLSKPVNKLVLKLPNIFMWWHPWRKASFGPHYTYPRYPSHALAEVVRLGHYTRDQARQSPPKAGHVVMILNPHDPGVNNQVARETTIHWRKNGYEQFEVYEFNKVLRLPHDIIDPGASEQNTTLVHPTLIQLITRPK